MRPMPRMADILFVVFCLGLGGVLLVHTYSDSYIGTGLGAAASPVFYPRILLLIWLALGLAILAQSFAQRALADTQASSQRDMKSSVLAIVALAVAVALFQSAGYLLVSVPLAFAIGWFLGERRVLPLAIVSVCAGVFTWWLFDRLLAIPLPLGMLDAIL